MELMLEFKSTNFDKQSKKIDGRCGEKYIKIPLLFKSNDKVKWGSESNWIFQGGGVIMGIVCYQLGCPCTTVSSRCHCLPLFDMLVG